MLFNVVQCCSIPSEYCPILSDLFSVVHYYSVLFNTVQHCSDLFSVVHYYSVLFRPVQCCSLLFSTVQYCSVLFRPVQCCSLLFSTQCSSILFSTVQYCSVLLLYCPQAYDLKGRVEESMLHYTEAAETYHKGLEQHPEDPVLKEGVERAQNKLGMYDTSSQLYSTVTYHVMPNVLTLLVLM